MLQMLCEKVEPKESFWKAAIRKTKEKMGLKIWPSYLVNDEYYDCDIYTYRLEEMEKPKRIKLEKASPWYLYSFKEYEERAEKKQMTPSHTKFFIVIVGEIEEKLT